MSIIQFFQNKIHGIDYNSKSPFIPLLIACLPGLSLLIHRVKSVQLRLLVDREWDSKDPAALRAIKYPNADGVPKDLQKAFENDKNVMSFKVVKLCENLSSLMHRTLVTAFTIFNRYLPVAAGVTLFIAGQVALTYLDSKATGAPVLSFHGVENNRTLVLYP